MTGVYILDKSTFQALSAAESDVLSTTFQRNLVPVLFYEILGDLAKEHSRHSGTAAVKELVDKISGSGTPVSLEFKSIAIGNLLGHPVAMTGQIIPDPEFTLETRDGGLLVDTTPLNMAILRWKHGDFHDVELQAAQLWRKLTIEFPVERLHGIIRSNGLDIPKVNSLTDAYLAASQLLSQSDAFRWLVMLNDLLGVPRDAAYGIEYRFATSSVKTLRLFAPYAYHVALVFLFFLVAHDNDVIIHGGKKVRYEPTNLVDLQYLNYLPFCQIFSSRDRLHLALAPYFLRKDQVFLHGDVLKRTLAEAASLIKAGVEASPDRGRFFIQRDIERDHNDLALVKLKEQIVRLANPQRGVEPG